MSVTVDDLFATLDPHERDRRITGNLLSGLIEGANGVERDLPAGSRWNPVLAYYGEDLQARGEWLSEHVLRLAPKRGAEHLRATLPERVLAFGMLLPKAAVGVRPGSSPKVVLELLLVLAEAETCSRRGWSPIEKAAGRSAKLVGWAGLESLPARVSELGLSIVQELRKLLWGKEQPPVLWTYQSDPPRSGR